MFLKKIVHQLPYIKEMVTQLKEFYFPPGHFYSPITSTEEVNRYKSQIWKTAERSLPGISIDHERMVSLLEVFKTYYDVLPFPEHTTQGFRYYYENDMYSYSDGIFLHCMLRYLRPKRYLEVGSGFSSAMALDTNERYFDHSMECIFIEPYADRLRSILKKEDAIQLVEQSVRDVPLDSFLQLEANDVLFIDSSHVCKTGSDLHYLFFIILPQLNKGVYIHFHDIFYPFEYPESWVLEDKRSWNESYMLRAFLSFNDAFEIVFFSPYLQEFYRDWLREQMPIAMKNGGGQIWIRKSK